jgi:hypothetical protein
MERLNTIAFQWGFARMMKHYLIQASLWNIPVSKEPFALLLNAAIQQNHQNLINFFLKSLLPNESKGSH